MCELFSQTVVTPAWVKNYSDRDSLYNVPSAIDANGNVYVTGSVQVWNQYYNFATIKYNQQGDTVWVRKYNGTGNSTDEALAIALDGSGNIIVTGKSINQNGNFDIVTLKYNSSGTLLWTNIYNGPQNGNDIPTDVTVDNSNNVYIVGTSNQISTYNSYVTIKYSTSGTQTWLKTYNATTTPKDYATSVLWKNNRLFVTGYTYQQNGTYSITTISYHPTNGTMLWLKNYGTLSAVPKAASKIVAYANNLYVSGTEGTNTNMNYLLVMYTLTNGNQQWVQTYDSYGLNDICTSLTTDNSGNAYITGKSLNTNNFYEYHTIKYNSSGSIMWINKYQTQLSSTLVNNKVVVDPYNMVYVCGEVKAGYGSDMLLYQITQSGNMQWDETYNGLANGIDVATDMVIDAQGQIFLTGQTQNNVAKFDYTTIKLTQSFVYNPIDLNNEPRQSSFDYIANKGQLINTNDSLIPEIKYYVPNTYPSLYFTPTRLSYVFAKVDTVQATPDTLHRIDMTFENSNTLARIFPIDSTNGYTNYYLAQCPQGITNVKGFERLFVPNIYPNIDLHYYSNNAGLKMYFVLKPGANPKDIALLFDGQTNLAVNNNNLEISSSIGTTSFEQPHAYMVNYGQQIIPVNWQPQWQVTGNRANFTIGTWNGPFPLVIMIDEGHLQQQQPQTNQNLLWSTYYGGSQMEKAYAINVDNNEQQNICGTNINSGFPLYNGATYPPNAAEQFCFLIAFDNLHKRVFTTIFGGSGNLNFAYDVKSNSSRDIYVVGKTNCSDFPTIFETGAWNDNIYSSTTSKFDGFIAKFNSTNGIIKWATYLGGNNEYNDGVSSLYVDSSDKLFLTGYTDDATFPVYNLTNATNQTFNGTTDIFIAKFNTSDNFDWCTFYGSTDVDKGLSITGDNSGNIYIYGYTSSTNFPIIYTTQYHQINNGGGDAFIARFNSSCFCNWSTCIGGNGYDCDMYGVLKCIDYSSGRLYIAGTTSSIDFPNTQNSYKGGYYDGYLCAFNSTGAMINSEYVGGNDWDEINAIVVDKDLKVFLTGTTKSADFPYQNVNNVYDQPNLGGDQLWNPYGDDAFILCYNSLFNLIWGTYFGGKSTFYDIAYDIEISGTDLYLTGKTTSKNIIQTPQVDALFPIVEFPGGYYDPTYNGVSDNNGDDVFISMLDLTPLVGINKIEYNYEVLIYPNPCKNNIIIELPDNNTDIIKIQTIDYLGRNYDTKYILKGNKININVNSLKQGVYLIKICSGNSIYFGKFIKQ